MNSHSKTETAYERAVGETAVSVIQELTDEGGDDEEAYRQAGEDFADAVASKCSEMRGIATPPAFKRKHSRVIAVGTDNHGASPIVELRTRLRDVECPQQETPGWLDVSLIPGNDSISITAAGYGVDDNDVIASLELSGGDLRVVRYGDFASDEPRIVSLNGAKRGAEQPNVAAPGTTAWSREDAEAAQGQGSDLFDEGDQLSIERIDETEVFRDDAEALEFVRKQAAAGDETAMKALRQHLGPVTSVSEGRTVVDSQGQVVWVAPPPTTDSQQHLPQHGP